MIRTGQQYRDSIRDGRQVWINGERVADVTQHPMFRPLVDVRARIYDMAHEPEHAAAMTYHDAESGTPCAIGTKLPYTEATGRQSVTPWTPCWTKSAASSPGSATRRSARCGRSMTARTC